MIRLGIVQCWSVAENQDLELGKAFFRVLDSIQSLGSIGKAAEELDVSYCHLWGLIGRWRKAIGRPSVLLERGRGAKLTPFGEKRLWMNKRVGARRFGLSFIPILEERYFFLCRKELLGTPRVQQIVKTLHDPLFRQQVNKLPGYRTKNCGAASSITKVFPKIKSHRQILSR
jgi:molybdenum-dependent DNA-binding transcriptional regulator ModE